MTIENITNTGLSVNTKQANTDFTNKKTDIAKEFLSEVQVSSTAKKNTDSKEQLEDIVDKMNKFLSPNNTSLKFQLHEELNEYYVTVVDEKTQEVVREIPSKKILDIYAAMTEFVGMVIDKKI